MQGHRGGALAVVLALLSSTPAAGQPDAEEAPAAVLSKPPRLLSFVEAVPPSSLAERGAADVTLTIDVDEHGDVTAVSVAESAGAEYDEAAVAAARQFRFEPGEAGGKPVPVRITYRYHFVMTPPPVPPAAQRAADRPGVPTVPLSGRVLRKGDRVPVAGVAVLVDDGTARTVTGEDGRFAFDALPLGTHVLKLRGTGTAPTDTPITLNAGKRLELTVYADAQERYTSTVRGERAVVETVEQTLQMEEIRYIPGTQGDTLKAVQNLPGVARAPFGIGLLPVWGSAPNDTRVYVDGVNIPVLYHFGGLRSVVNSEMVDSLSFVPGGYLVDRGLGLGGAIDVRVRNPRRDGYHGYAQMDLLDGSLMLEGPLTKTLSFAVAGRRSWVDATLPLFTTNTLQLSPVYWDYQARLSWRPPVRDELDVFLLGSDDKLDVVARRRAGNQTSAASHTYFHRVLARWIRRLESGGALSLTASAGYDVPFQLGVRFGTIPTSIDARSLAYTTRADADLPLFAWLRLHTGVDYEGARFSQNRSGVARPPIGGATGASVGGFGEETGSFGGQQSGYASDGYLVYTNHVAPFAAAQLTFFGGRFVATPQLRLQVMTFAGDPGTAESFNHTYLAPEPRLAVRFRLLTRLWLKGAIGLYSQPPSPDMLSRVFGNPNLRPQAATHYVVGADFDVTPKLRLETEAFWKDMRKLVVRGEDPTGPVLTNEGEGRSYGVQFLLRQQLARRFFGWTSYTFSRSERRDHAGLGWHPFLFDQTHILTLMGSYQLPRGFQVGARYRYVTGNPNTPITGAFFDSNGDRYVPLPGVPFSARLSPFNQFDLRADKIWTFDRWRFSIYLDVQNVFRTTNAESVTYNHDFTVATPLAGLPLLPILGARGDF